MLLRALIAGSLIAAACPAEARPASAGASAEVERAFTAFILAARAGDRKALAEATDPVFVQHHGTGLTEDRSVWLESQGLAGAAAGGAAGTAFLELGPSVRVSGGTAIRSSFVRLRRAERGLDLWSRSTAVLVRGAGRWRVADLATAILWEGPITDIALDPAVAGAYRTEQGQAWTIRIEDGLARLESGPGRFVPLFPIGPDLLSSGTGSTLRAVRGEGGRILAVERYFGERRAWKAARLQAVSGP